MSFKKYSLNVLIACDQLVNTLLNGFPDETISSRCYRLSSTSRCAKVACKVLDFIFRPWGKNHCQEAYNSELQHKQNFVQEE